MPQINICVNGSKNAYCMSFYVSGAAMHLLRTFNKVLLRRPFGHAGTGGLCPASSHLTGVNKETHSYSCLFTLRRHYCDGRQPEVQAKVKTLYIPNPFVLIKNKWLTYRIQNEIDPDFNLDEFVIGASYVSILS